jgi:hypothetical protein
MLELEKTFLAKEIPKGLKNSLKNTGTKNCF